MIYWLDEPRHQQEVAVRRAFGITLALSLLIHAAALFMALQRLRELPPDDGKDSASDRLQVRLAMPAPPSPPPAPQPQPRILTAPREATPALTQAPRPRPRVPRPPTVLATPAPAPPIAQAQTPTPPSPAPARTQTEAKPAEADLWSYLQARRRERGEQVESIVASNRDADADLAANLPRPATGAATKDVNRGGGIFEIKSMAYDDASFIFFGWNPDMGRETPQLITVRIGSNPDMRIAVVRRMIAIIRDYTHEDFFWRSAYGRGAVLSAREKDNDALESYLMHEFFDDHGEPR
ncbi:MAG TPA: hypothetical protein VMN79_01365 [Casimicrobiaceae bacterium]|nr:hypothetical protein [Casimicrobiaceae bacterium]